MNDDVMLQFEEKISKFIKKNQINHAYLIETNYSNKIEIAKIIINKILSFENNISYEDLLNNGDLIIIDNESNTIKADEIEVIKENFKTKSIINSKRIYIINNAEKLNNVAANKLLKFIEEPEEDIIAILTTENKNNVINTIVSRCFNIRLFLKEEMNEYQSEYLDKLVEFVNNIEINKEKAIAFQNINSYFYTLDRVNLKKFLNDLLLVYDDAIHYKVCNSCEIFTNRIDLIKKICDDNSINDIKNKINSINICINRLKYNPNIKLLIDKMILLMAGDDIDA